MVRLANHLFLKIFLKKFNLLLEYLKIKIYILSGLFHTLSENAEESKNPVLEIQKIMNNLEKLEFLLLGDINKFLTHSYMIINKIERGIIV